MYKKIVFFLVILSSLALSDNIEVDFMERGNGIGEHRIIDIIHNAKHSILVAGYAFTDTAIAEELIKAYQRGVSVAIVLDKKENMRTPKAVAMLLNANIPLRYNQSYSIMHNKFIVIDNLITESGSYNYTFSAEKYNAENILIINSRSIAWQYTNEWKKLFSQGN